MSIVSMKKVTIAGSLLEKRKSLRALQNLGLMHVVPLTTAGKKPIPSYDNINEVIKYLNDAPEIVEEQIHPKDFNIDEVIADILMNKKEVEDVTSYHKSLYFYIEEIKHWGDFKVPSPEKLGGNVLHFFKTDRKSLDRIAEETEYTFQCVSCEDDCDIDAAYIVVIAKEGVEVTIPGAHRVDVWENMSYSEAVKALEDTNIELAANTATRVELTKYLQVLERYKDRLVDAIDYTYVLEHSLDKDNFYLVQGWIADKRLKDLKSLAEKYHLAISVEDAPEDEQPPTLLENNKLGSPGEELVRFYQMPAYKMWDPSTLMFLSFAIFFAMIVSDFGYGSVLGILTALTWKKLSGSETALRVRRMLVGLSGSCMVYGVICGSYFGYKAPIKGLADLAVVDVNNFTSMISLSVGMGAVHLVIANIIRFFNAFPKMSSISFIGWIAIITGAYSLYYFGQETLWAQYSLIIGSALVFFFSSDRPFTLKGILLRPLEGLLNLTNLTKAFGDCLSYIRLFALGLSSALLAASFNSMAEQAMSDETIVGITLGILVLIFGHALNIVLAIMGGIIHGLRLNFIEFSNWGLDGEGYEFKPFELKEKKKWKI